MEARTPFDIRANLSYNLSALIPAIP